MEGTGGEHDAQWRVGTKDLLLSDDLGKRLWTQTIGQRARSGARLRRLFPAALIEKVRKAGYNRGARMVETSWILEDNDGMRNIIETIGGQAYKTYRVYQKEL